MLRYSYQIILIVLVFIIILNNWHKDVLYIFEKNKYERLMHTIKYYLKPFDFCTKTYKSSADLFVIDIKRT